MEEVDHETRFDLTYFFAYRQKHRDPDIFNYFFQPEKLTWLFLLKEVKPSVDRKMTKLSSLLIISDNIFAKTRSRMTTTMAFSRQNDVGSHARAT